MKLAQAILAFLLIGSLTSCISQKPREFSSIYASRYNNVDVPADLVWQTAIQVLGERYEITANDSINKVLKVRTFDNVATIKIIALNEVTSKFTVSSRNTLVPSKSTVNTIYFELERALKNIEN